MPRMRKEYGKSKIAKCLFCGKQGFSITGQNIPVCKDHKNAVLNDLKCVCGDYLDALNGRYGLYFRCMKCGNVPLRKVLEFNEIKDVSKKADSVSSTPKKSPAVLEVRSDDPRFFD